MRDPDTLIVAAVLVGLALTVAPGVRGAEEPAEPSRDAADSAPAVAAEDAPPSPSRRSAAAGLTIETTMVGLDDALTTGKRQSELELTLGWSEADRAFTADGSTVNRGPNDTTVATATFSHGFAPHLDVIVSTFGLWVRDADEPDPRGDGFGDLFVDVKWRFRDGRGPGGDGLYLAWRPALSLPLGDDDDGAGQAAGLGYGTVGQSLVATVVDGRWVLGGELNLLFPVGGDRDSARGFGAVAFGAGYAVTPTVKPEVEVQYARDYLEGSTDSEVVALTAGLIVNVSGSVRLDLGLRRGVWGRNVDRRLTASANVSWTFGGPTG